MAGVKKKEEVLVQMADIRKKVRSVSFLALPAANLWALAHACFLRRTYVLQCSELTCAAADEASAVAHGLLLCCSVLQAAAAVLALLLTGQRRRCRALTYAALAGTTVAHCVYGRIQWLLLLAAYPGDGRIVHGLWLSVSVIALVGDLLFLNLLVEVGRADEYAGKASVIDLC